MNSQGGQPYNIYQSQFSVSGVHQGFHLQGGNKSRPMQKILVLKHSSSTEKKNATARLAGNADSLSFLFTIGEPQNAAHMLRTTSGTIW